MYIRASLALVVLLAAGLMTSASSASAVVADTIYSGGDIVTIDEAQPSAEALAVKEGRTIYRAE